MRAARQALDRGCTPIVDDGRFTIQYATIVAAMACGATAPCARARLASERDNFHRMIVPLRHGLQRAVVPDDTMAGNGHGDGV